jgi:hypothetical protein
MRAFGLVLIVTSAAVPALAQSPTLAHWTPTTAQIQEVEAAIQIPSHYLLSQYSRYYVAYSFGDRHTLNGELVKLDSGKPGVYIVDNESKFPMINDGGCNIIHISYDFDLHRLAAPLKCNGFG